MKPIRVLIVDDSALVRRMLKEILNSDSAIEVVGHAADPYLARDKIKKLNPDVLTLDIEMPKMDGIKFLRNLMRLRPMPVVMVSSLTQHGADKTLEALALGAVDYVSKPRSDLANTFDQYAEEIIAKVKLAASARVRAAEPGRYRSQDQSNRSDLAVEGDSVQRPLDLIAIGASTGGTEAIKELLHRLPAEVPGVVIVQHIPKEFSAAFAARLDNSCALAVKQAEDGDEIRPGCGYLAPGNRHLTVFRDGPCYRCRLDESERINQHRPSVDRLFTSVAQAAGAKALGIIMTGMGADGAQGLAEMHRAGAATMAQDETTSVIWGMPKEAVDLGCVDQVLPLFEIPKQVRALLPSQGVQARV